MRYGSFSVKSYGNGWAYTLTAPGGKSRWFQDDDAAEFEKELAALDNMDDTDRNREITDSVLSEYFNEEP